MFFTLLASSQWLWFMYVTLPAGSRQNLPVRAISPAMRYVERPLACLAGGLQKTFIRLGNIPLWTRLSAKISEPAACLLIGLLLLTVYLTAGIFLPTVFLQSPGANHPIFGQAFGFSQFQHASPFLIAAGLILGALVVLWVQLRPGLAARWLHAATEFLYSQNIHLVVLSALCVGIFFLLRSNYLNPDALEFEEKFLRDVPLLGAHVTHDEMWELYLHSRFWLFTSQRFGWGVVLSYQVLSVLAGGIFVFLLLKYCRLVQTQWALAFFMLVCSGGFMQLFFGDVENYTLASACIMAYFYASALFFKGKLPLVVPATILALAMTFHLLAGFFLPSLAYLFYRALRRKQDGGIFLAFAGFCSVIGLTLVFFHFNGLPIQNLFQHSHAFGAVKNPLWYLAPVSLDYFWQQFNLGLLLFPGAVLLLPLLFWQRIACNPVNIHLILASLAMFLFQWLWRAQLGVYADWNLYAAGALTISLLVGRNILEVPALRRRPAILALLLLTFAAHSLAWIGYNHFIGG